MLEPNSWIKPQQWFARHAYTRRCLPPPSDWQHEGKVTRPKRIELQTVVADLDQCSLPSVRCIVLEYQNINPEVMDGANVFIRPGHFTPSQYVETNHKFTEIPLCGRMIYLGVKPDGQLVKHFFEVGSHDNAPQVAVAKQGELMRIFACKTQNYQPSEFVKTFWPDEPIPNVEVLEHVEPGFVSAKLVTVPDYATQIGNTQIPKEFWGICDMLEQGNEEEIIKSI